MSYPLSIDLAQKQAPGLKQMQRLMMSPQMQQALHMLQAPVMELSVLIEAELEQNPVLETIQEEGNSDDHEEENFNDPHEDMHETQNIQPEKELTFDERDFRLLLQIDEEFKDYFREGIALQQKNSDEEKLHTYLENTITAEVSLFEHLMNQAREVFPNEDLKMAEAIIGSLDQKGFLLISLNEIAKFNGFDESSLKSILKKVQSFEPSGVGATNLQEALLIQLRNQGQTKTLAYQIVEKHYEDFIHNRIPVIQKKMRCTLQDIAQAIKEDLARLDMHPGTCYSKEPIPSIIPDVSLQQEEDKLIVLVNDDPLPNFRINHRYLKMLEDENLSSETKEFIHQKIMSAKWLMRNIHQRSSTLEKIVASLAEKQREFFLSPEGNLVPMTMKMLAEELQLHESTIARAVANKYLNSPRGILPLRSFFTNAYATQEGDISSQTVREVLLDIIQQEDKRKPLSDKAIVSQLQNRGIICARRTVAKYRALLNIGSAHQRKQF